MKKLLIGGKALMQLGSSRHTSDTDYLTFLEDSKQPFVHLEGDIDLINANGNTFFAQVWEMEAKNEGEIASPQALLELKCYAFSKHCELRHFQKVDNAEFDIKFLVRTFGLKEMKLAHKHMPLAHANELRKMIKEVRI